MLRFSPLIRVEYFPEPLGTLLEFASRWSLLDGADVLVLTINSPAPVEMHRRPLEFAVVLGTACLDAGAVTRVYSWLASALPPGFEVTYRPTHVSVDYHAARGAGRVADLLRQPT